MGLPRRVARKARDQRIRSLDDVRADARVPERVVLLPKPFSRASLADAIAAAVATARLP